MTDMLSADHTNRLFPFLCRLLELPATTLRDTLTQASDLVAEALVADKVDVFLCEPATSTLVAFGTSTTPLGDLQLSLGLDRLPLANGGREVEVFQTGRSYLTGRADEDPEMLLGIREALAVRSVIAAPLEVAGQRRGVLSVQSLQMEAYTTDHLHFVAAIAHWIGTLIHRAELVEELTDAATREGRRRVAEELMRVLAHDLSNHLTPLHFRLNLIARRARKEGYERILEDADDSLRALHRLRALINDLLDDARLEHGVLGIQRTLVNVGSLVRDVVELLDSSQGMIHLHQTDELDALWDAPRIQQVLENLLSNALKHSPPGAMVEVRVESETREGSDWALITISNQGPPISPTLLPRIFDRFVTGSESSGLGLGLYLAKQLAQAHGGDVTIQSSSPNETSFRLALPVQPPAELLEG